MPFPQNRAIFLSLVKNRHQTKGTFVKQELVQKLVELEELVGKMDVPIFRRRSVRWLERNLAVRNASHPDFDKVMVLVRDLLSHGVG